jgi:hypothetical protein
LVGAFFGWRQLQQMTREHPERFPWTELSLNDPVGRFTGMKLAALGDDGDKCRALLRQARLAETPHKTESSTPQCRVDDGVMLRPEDSRSIRYSPASLATSCPVAAALALWEREVVQPAAQRYFGAEVTRIDHAGSFSCRRLYGRAEGRFSEHATADAIDIAGFRLVDGRRINVLNDWRGGPAEAAFLRQVRDGACDLFSTVLSPDYNSAHADHFHLDMAGRGATGWRLCR